MSLFSYYVWTIDYEKDEPKDKKFYVRLERRSRWNYKLLWKVDYQRFETYQQAQTYLETLPDPETSGEWEMEVSKICGDLDIVKLEYYSAAPKSKKNKKKAVKK